MASTEAAAPETNQAPVYRVFVGNLPFKTTAEELSRIFSELAPTRVNIAARGTRSLGYGFVEFETEANAENAVQLQNEKDFQGRVLRVQKAHARGQRPAGAPANRRRPVRNFRGPRVPRTEGKKEGASESAPVTNASKEERTAGQRNQGDAKSGFKSQRRPFRPRGPRRDNNAAGATQPPAATTEGQASARNGPVRRRRFNRAPVSRPAGESVRIRNENALFVANLPFSVKDETLKDVFKEFAVSNARVITKRDGRSKGYGFVEFQDDQARTAALGKFEKHILEGRELTIKLAVVKADEPAKPSNPSS